MEETSDVRIDMYAATGEKVGEFSFGTLQAGDHQLELAGDELKAGLYIYRTFINGRIRTGKLIKVE